MFKWIFGISVIYSIIGFLTWNYSSSVNISKQIDVKTMAIVSPNYFFSERSVCNGICENKSSSWGGGSGGK